MLFLNKLLFILKCQLLTYMIKQEDIMVNHLEFQIQQDKEQAIKEDF